MFKIILIGVVFISHFSFSCKAWVPDEEEIETYDSSLQHIYMRFEHFLDNKNPDYYGLFEGYHTIGDEILTDSFMYKYFLEDVTSRTIKIRAENKFGGRSYIYDYEWNVTHYIFQKPMEAHRVGKVLIEWLISDKDMIKKEDPNILSEPRRKRFASVTVALGFWGICSQYFNLQSVKFDVQGCLGTFLVYDDLRNAIFKIVEGKEVYATELDREKVVRGIISNYESYPKKLQQEVLKKISGYLKTIKDEKTKYSKKIAEFVLEKGGKLPNRTYWDYDTRSIPLYGRSSARRKGDVKVKVSIKTISNLDKNKKTSEKTMEKKRGQSTS